MPHLAQTPSELHDEATGKPAPIKQRIRFVPAGTSNEGRLFLKEIRGIYLCYSFKRRMKLISIP